MCRQGGRNTGELRERSSITKQRRLESRPGAGGVSRKGGRDTSSIRGTVGSLSRLRSNVDCQRSNLDRCASHMSERRGNSV